MLAELFLARRYLFRAKARHISFIGLVSCMGIALGVATLIIVISVMNGFDRDLMDRFMRFNHHLVLESRNIDELLKLKAELEPLEEVKGTSIFLQTQVFAKFDNLILPLVVKGISFTDSSEKEAFYKYVKEERANEGFFIGDGLEKRFGKLKEIEFYPLKKKLKLEKEKVRGVFKVGLYDIDNNYLIADLERVKSLSSNYLILLGVRMKNPFKAEFLKKRIADILGPDVFISTWIDRNRALFSALKLEKITMFIILSLIILVACFSIFATLTVRVIEKTKDIGILKSLGFSSKQILSIFSLQGLLMGFIGTGIGAFLGLTLCFVLKNYPFIRLPEEIYYIEYLPVAINYTDIFLITLLGLILSYIFSLFPAIRAAKLSPVEALKYE